MAEKAESDGTVWLRVKPPTSVATYWANSKSAPKKDEGNRPPPRAIVTEEESGEESEEGAGKKKKRIKGEQIQPTPFLRGRKQRGPGRGLADQRRVCRAFQHVRGFGGKEKKKPPRPSLSSPKEPEEGNGARPSPVKGATSSRGRAR
jgi:hypothetical protein